MILIPSDHGRKIRDGTEITKNLIEQVELIQNIGDTYDKIELNPGNQQWLMRGKMKCIDRKECLDRGV